MPLAPHQGDLVIIEGLLQEGGGGDGHQNGIGGMLTGSPLNPGPFAGVGAPPAGWATGPSIDQRIVQALAAPTPFQSLELGVQVGARRQLGADNLPGGQPAAPAHRRSGPGLHAACSPTCTPIPSRSLTCGLATSRSSMRWGASTCASAGQLGSADKQRLDAHLDAVRGIEKRLTTSLVDNNPSCHDPVLPSVVVFDGAGERLVPRGRRPADGSPHDGARLQSHAGGVDAVVAFGVARCASPG